VTALWLVLLGMSLAAESAPSGTPRSQPAAPPAATHDAHDPDRRADAGSVLRDTLARPALSPDAQEQHLALRRLLDHPRHGAWARQQLLELVRREPTHPSWLHTYERLLDQATDVAVRAELQVRRDAASIRQAATRAERLQTLRQAVQRSPDDVVSRRLLAQALLLEGRPAASLAVLLQGPPDPASAELRYLATLGSRALSGAPLQRLARAAGHERAPADGVGAARVLEQAGYSAAAEVALQTHSGTPSTSPAALKVYCRLLLDRGETERARVLLTALLRVHPDDAQAQALLESARTPWSPESLDLAGLRAALHRDPGSAELLGRWARLSLQAGHDPLRGLLYGAAHTAPQDLDRVADWIATARRARGDDLRDQDPEQAAAEYALASLSAPDPDPAARLDRVLRLALHRSHAASLALARARWLER